MFSSGERLIQSFNQNAVTVEVTDLAAPSKKSPILILHVDDDSSIRDITKLMLLDFDSSFEVDSACCVVEAFEKIKNHQYDTIVSDYEMPQKNGLEFLKELREQKNEIAFIIFTGRGREDVAVQALNLGADRYLNKNGSPEVVYGELAYAIKNIVEQKKSRQLLRSSESKYRTLVEKSLQGVMIAQDSPLRISFANAAIGKMLGYEPEEFTLFSPEEVVALVHPEDRTLFFNRFKDRLEGIDADNSYEFRAVRKDGSIMWMEAFASKIEYNGGLAVQAVFMDIGERKKSEEVIKKSEARYRELANFLPEIVFETDLTGKITFFSQTAFELTGYTPMELEKGLNMLQFVIPKEREKAKENIKRRMTGEKTVSSEYTLIRKNGDIYPAIVKTAPIYSQNKLIGLRGLVIDITERKQQELKIENLVKFPSENPNAVFRIDKNGTILYENASGDSFLKIWNSKIGEHAPKYISQVVADALASNKRIELEENCETKTFSLMFAPIISEGYVNIYANDITERKKVDKQIRSIKEFDERVIDSLGDALLIINPEDFTIFNANKMAHEQLKLERKNLIGKTCYETTHSISTPCEAPKHICPIREIMKTGKPLTVEHTHLNSQQKEVIVEISAYPVKNEQGKTVVVHIAKDITQKRLMERELRESEAKFRTITNSVRDAIIMVNDKARVTYWNPAAEIIFGYSSEEAIGIDVHQLVVPVTVSKVGREFIKNGVATFSGTGVGNFTFGDVELIGHRKDGSEFPAKMSLSAVNLEGKWNAVGVVKDITDRKQAEQKLQEAEKRYHALFNEAPLGVLVIDHQTSKPIEFNDLAHESTRLFQRRVFKTVYFRF